MTFAQLARTVLGDMDQSSMTKLREAYQAQPYVGAVTPECKVDTHSSVHDFPQELLIIKEYLLVTLAQVEHHLWRPYNLPPGSPSSFQQQSFVLPCLTAFALRLQVAQEFQEQKRDPGPYRVTLGHKPHPLTAPKVLCPCTDRSQQLPQGTPN